jgi:iron complex transport system ATP-binding protein
MPFLEVDQLSFSYRRKPFIHALNLSIEEGGVLALLGPNGSGKTTILKLLLGLLSPSKGAIRIQGKDMRSLSQREISRKLAYVPQTHREAFGYSVYDVVLMGRLPHISFFSRYGESDRRIAAESIGKMGIEHLAERPYTEISGGERQLTLIARALAQGAMTFIMDEPMNGLDYGNQIRLLEKISCLARDGYTFIFTTHHPDHALSIADRAVMIKSGTIFCDGSPSSVIAPKNLAAIYGISEKLFGDHADRQHYGMPKLRLQTA